MGSDPMFHTFGGIVNTGGRFSTKAVKPFWASGKTALAVVSGKSALVDVLPLRSSASLRHWFRTRDFSTDACYL